MKTKSLNSNPPLWEKDLVQKTKVYFHNIHSLRDKMDDIRSICQSDKELVTLLREIIPADGCCLVIGDFNICAVEQPNHEVFTTLKSRGFHPLISEATHFEGGHLDQAWIRGADMEYSIDIYSPYYTSKDHDALQFTYYNSKLEPGSD